MINEDKLLERALHELGIDFNVFFKLAGRGWVVFWTGKRFELRNDELVSDGYVAAWRAPWGGPEHLADAYHANQDPNVVTPPWQGEGADTLLLHIRDAERETPVFDQIAELLAGGGSVDVIVNGEKTTLGADETITAKCNIDASQAKGAIADVIAQMGGAEQVQTFPYGSFGGTLHKSAEEAAKLSPEELAQYSKIVTSDAKTRKGMPVATGLLDYFPDACLDVARLSRIGNDQHNPGEPMHWARGKSQDERDTMIRHTMESGIIDADKVLHDTKAAWRALAQCQKAIERLRAQGIEYPPKEV